MKKLLIIGGMAVTTICHAADYHWTGAAGDHLWSTAGNWETSTGAAVESVDVANAHTYNFGTRSGTDVGWGGNLVVTQDINVAIGSAMALNPHGNDYEALEIVSAAGCKMSILGDDNRKCSIYVQRNSQLKLTVDMSGDSYTGTILKYGNGRLVWNLKAANAKARTLQVFGGKVLLGGQDTTASCPQFYVQMCTGKDFTTACVENLIEGGSLSALYVGVEDRGPASIGRVYLNDKTLNVGASAASASTNQMPMAIFGEGGTLALRDERCATMRGLPMGGTLAVDRADARIDTPNTAIRWLFENADNPTRDDVGSGYRMLAPNGMPDVAIDATRGSVLSISGGKYFKGPDANAGLDGLLLQTTNNPYTVAFWFKPDANCDNLGKIFYWGGNQEGYKSAGLRLNNDTAKGLMFTLWGDNRVLNTSTSPRDGNWHHFAVVYNGYGICTIYYDGEQVDQFTVASTYNPPNKNFYIGRVYGGWTTDGGNPYTGLLDDFLIGSYALSADEIAAIKDDGLAAAIPVGSVAAYSAGEVAFAKNCVSAKTLSGNALAGGVTMLADGSTLTVGAEAGTVATTFKGGIGGGDTTLVKEGADYALTLSGPAAAVTNVVVKEGTLELRRPTARAGLVAYYSFDDAAIGADSSPAGFTLSKTGSGTVSQIADGVSGKALNFGGSAYLKSPDNLHAMFPKGNDSYTVSMWIKPTAEAYSNNRPLYCWGVDSSNPGLTSSFMRLNGGNSGGGVMLTHWGDNFVAAAGNLADGKWHHVVAVYDGATRVKTVYVDGTAYVAPAIGRDVAVNGGTCLYIGSRSQSTSTTYSGGMDEFMVIAGAWTADEVAAEYARKAPALVAAETLLPTPIAHWTFDDDAAPGADSSANALNLTMNGTVTLEDGDFICGKAARFSASSGFFTLDTFPTGVIPSGDVAFTVVGRYRADTSQASYNSVVVRWGEASKWETGGLFILGTGSGSDLSSRLTMCSIHGANSRFYRTEMGTDRSRWMTVAAVIGPKSSNTRRIRLYVDGELVSDVTNRGTDSLVAQEFSIGSSVAGDRNFYGLIDDVRIYDKTLSAGQIRLIAEQMEAAKGDAAVATSATLPCSPDVSVAAGATLKVSSVDTIASLSGAGDVEIAPLGRLSVEKVADFTGSVAGAGALGIADNAVLEFGDGSSPVLVSEGTIALGANVTVNAVLGEGRQFTLATAASFTGIENLSTWKWSNNGVLKAARFKVSPDGKSLRLSRISGMVISFH